MRSLLHLLTLLALLVAPLAAPAAAMAAAQPSASECTQMAPHHKLPTSHHAAGEPCCIAVPPAIDPSPMEVAAVVSVSHIRFIALAQSFVLGAGPQFEDPPPRTA